MLTYHLRTSNKGLWQTADVYRSDYVDVAGLGVDVWILLIDLQHDCGFVFEYLHLQTEYL